MWEVYKCGVKECRAWGGEEQDAGGQGGGRDWGEILGLLRRAEKDVIRVGNFFPFVFDKWLVG